jgi:osmotically inducible lipoprotein OsmB
VKSVRFGAFVLVLLLTGCAHDPSMREIGTATGAVAGGLIGNALIGSTAGTLVGAGAGALLGNDIGGRHYRRKQAHANRARAAHRVRNRAPVTRARLDRNSISSTSL